MACLQGFQLLFSLKHCSVSLASEAHSQAAEDTALWALIVGVAVFRDALGACMDSKWRPFHLEYAWAFSYNFWEVNQMFETFAHHCRKLFVADAPKKCEGSEVWNPCIVTLQAYCFDVVVVLYTDSCYPCLPVPISFCSLSNVDAVENLKRMSYSMAVLLTRKERKRIIYHLVQSSVSASTMSDSQYMWSTKSVLACCTVSCWHWMVQHSAYLW